MQVSFMSLDSIMDEAAADNDLVDGGLVRCEMDSRPKSNGVDEVYVRVAFTYGGDIREYIEKCGESPANRGERDGREIAAGRMIEIAKRIVDAGLTPRRGIIVP